MADKEFSRTIKKILYRNLPMSGEYGFSNRVEGALVRSEETAAQKTAAIIVDAALDKSAAEQLCTELYSFLSGDQFFKKTKSIVISWGGETFTMMRSHGVTRLTSIKGVKADIEGISADGSFSGDWTNFYGLYKPHRSTGQVFLLTTQEKVDSLEQAGHMMCRNLVIVYPHSDQKDRPKKIKNIPCVPVRM